MAIRLRVIHVAYLTCIQRRAACQPKNIIDIHLKRLFVCLMQG